MGKRIWRRLVRTVASFSKTKATDRLSRSMNNQQRSSAGGVTEPGPPMQAYDVNCDGLLDLILGPSASVSPINNITIFSKRRTGPLSAKQTSKTPEDRSCLQT